MGKQKGYDGVDTEFDFLSAIEAHVRWKIRLEAYIAGTSDEELNEEIVGSDVQCALGQWIYGEGGEKHGDHPKFEGLKETHMAFHNCAGGVVRAVHTGELDKAWELLRGGEYGKYSHQIKAELARLSLELNPHVDEDD